MHKSQSWLYLDFGQEVYEEFLSQDSQCGVSDMCTVHPATHASLIAWVIGEDIFHCKEIQKGLCTVCVFSFGAFRAASLIK